MLSSALKRQAVPHQWMKELSAVSESPLVTVFDADLSGYDALLESMRAQSPWNRSYVITRDHAGALASTARVVRKPFDAASFAQSLSFDYQLAALDRQRRAETKRLESELEHSQRLAHLGRISATMSHEINNPLAVIRSCAAWLGGYAQEHNNAELAETVHDLELASERIVGFVDQISGFARKGDPDFQRLPLGRTLEVALRMVRPRAVTKHVELIVAADAELGRHAVFDSSRMAQAIINVIANGVDAAAVGGGKVWIDVGFTSRHAHIRVTDDGPGISDDIRESVFEPFATTKPHGEGTGLGLSLTRDILLEHGGNVLLRERVGGGTIAELVWPLAGPLPDLSGGK